MAIWQGIESDKPFYRIAFTGPWDDSLAEIRLYSAIYAYLKLKVQDATLSNKTIVICAPGIKAGFMPTLYSTARGIKGPDKKPLLTSAYISCDIFGSGFQYELEDCDERIVCFPQFGTKPEQTDSSIQMLSDAHEHIMLGLPNSDLSSFNVNLAIQKAEKDPNFQFRTIEI
jgi:hypothetical protein